MNLPNYNLDDYKKSAYFSRPKKIKSPSSSASNPLGPNGNAKPLLTRRIKLSRPQPNNSPSSFNPSF